MNRIFVILALLGVLLMPSCRRHSEGWSRLDLADSLMEQAPDSALAILEEIDPDSLLAGHERARHALLLSMALDKNYIDLDTFAILQPAIDYYSEHGSPDERLRMHYYQGRIHYNRNELNKALDCFIQAHEMKDRISDLNTYGRTLVAEGAIYYNSFDAQKSTVCFTEAAKLYETLNNPTLQFRTWNRVLATAIQLEDKALYDSVHPLCIELMEQNPQLDLNIDSREILYAMTFLDKDSLLRICNRIAATNPSDEEVLLNLTSGFSDAGLAIKGKEFFEKVSPVRNGFEDSLRYLAVKSVYLDSLHDSEGAKNAYIQYFAMESNSQLSMIQNDIYSIQRQYDAEIEKLRIVKDRKILYITLFGVIILFAALICIISYHFRLSIAKNKLLEQELSAKIDALESERDKLNNLLSSHADIDPKLKTVVLQRLEMLNKLLLTKLSNNSKYVKSVDEFIKNKEEFIASTQRLFAVTHPHFATALQKYNLTDEECDYLYLMALGLSGKDAGEYINAKRHYHLSCEIRKKLNLSESDTNLNLFVRSLLKSKD